MQVDNQEIFSKVYRHKVNIYSLRRKYKHYPDIVFFDTCEFFLKYEPKVKNKWAWFVRVLTEKYRQHNAEKEVSRAQEIKRQGANVSLLKQLGLLGKTEGQDEGLYEGSVDTDSKRREALRGVQHLSEQGRGRRIA